MIIPGASPMFKKLVGKISSMVEKSSFSSIESYIPTPPQSTSFSSSSSSSNESFITTPPQASSCSSIVPFIPTGPQVFINFRGKDVRKGFISFLVPALKEENINVFIDEQEERGKTLISLFDTICESKVALVIFSEGYTESKWCLDELVQIKECMDQNNLRVIPIFYKLNPTMVKCLQGEFGNNFRAMVDRYPEKGQKWLDALTSVSRMFALVLPKNSEISERDFSKSIVNAVKKVLKNNFEGRNGENDDVFEVPESKLTITMQEAPNKEAVEVSVLNEVYLPNNMGTPGPSYEFKFLVTRPKCNVFMINARELSITWSENSEHWTWLALPKQNQNETVVEIAYLRKASWLQVAGKFDTRHLSPRTTYEVVFVVGVVHTKFRWDKPVKLKLAMPNSCEEPQERSVKMGHYISNQWVDIPVGEFTTSMNNVGEISFEMYEHECQLWKSGLFVKSVIIRPKY
ncbi:Protein PHLOEM PROTEIN 2-LIKE A5 [Cardamine amara subsp. amara]|uniref:Protein PHLOEM PROTEIN 2-LIKE A5 n=1 Tax=Cardamine amara subsp. amara TaxID=228776 RepID=A0ABD1C386_CARAN